MTRRVLVVSFLIVGLMALASATSVRKTRSIEHKDYPKYCCTDAGVLGPYENNSVPEGGACYGTTPDGKRHEGTACYGKEKPNKQGYPKYCCTDAGKLGPYDNDSVPEGGACYGTKNGQRYEGTACY